MSSLSKDKNIEHMVTTVELFVQSLSQLMAVFSGYDGGEFCSGLLFGSTGASMLTNIAQALATFTNVSENKPIVAAIENKSQNNNRTFRDTSTKNDSTLKNKFNKNKSGF